MSYTRVYADRIEWHNYPNVTTPIDEINLNKMDYALNQIDGTLENWDTTKADESDMLLAVKTIVYNSTNGKFTITFFNNTTTVIDTLLEKLAINFDYDDNPSSQHYQNLIIELSDGTYKYIDMSALITQYEFIDSSTMHFTVNQDGEITVDIIDGSVTAQKLQPNFLADCVAAKNAAQSAQTGAETAEDNAEAWAVGKKNGQDVPSTDPQYHNNAKYYAETVAQEKVEDSEAWAVGKRNGQDVDPTDPTYHNNAKYYAEMSDPTALRNMSDVDIATDKIAKGDILINGGEKWSNYPSTENLGIAIGKNATAIGITSIAFSDGLSDELNSISSGNMSQIPSMVTDEGSVGRDLIVSLILEVPVTNGNILEQFVSDKQLLQITDSTGVSCNDVTATILQSHDSIILNATQFNSKVISVFNYNQSLSQITLSSSSANDILNGYNSNNLQWFAEILSQNTVIECYGWYALRPNNPVVISKQIITDDIYKGDYATLNVSLFFNWQYYPAATSTSPIIWSGDFDYVTYEYIVSRPLSRGVNSVAVGEGVVASGRNSHATGYGTQANKSSMIACGDFNDYESVDTTDYDLLQVGNGTDSANRSNAFSVRKDGTIGATGGLGIQLKTDNTKAIKFGVDDYGNYGYIKAGADSVTPFRHTIFCGFQYIRSISLRNSSGTAAANYERFGFNASSGLMTSFTTDIANRYRFILNKSGYYAIILYTTAANVNAQFIYYNSTTGTSVNVIPTSDKTAHYCYVTIDRETNTFTLKELQDTTNLNDIEYSYLEADDYLQCYVASSTTSRIISISVFHRYDGSWDRWNSGLSATPARVL